LLEGSVTRLNCHLSPTASAGFSAIGCAEAAPWHANAPRITPATTTT
jgi:hypothetical protein